MSLKFLTSTIRFPLAHMQKAWHFVRRTVVRFAPAGNTHNDRDSPIGPSRRDEISSAVVQIYQLALHRAPSALECASWADQVVAGNLRVETMIEAIASSPEGLLAQQTASRNASVASAQGARDSVISSDREDEINGAVVRIYQLVLRRVPSAAECASWANQVIAGNLRVETMIEAIASCPEALLAQQAENLVPEVPNGRFVQFAIDELLGRGPLVDEIAHWDYRIARGMLSRGAFVNTLFGQRAEQMLTHNGAALLHDPSKAWIMGTERFISVREWQEDAAKIPNDLPPVNERRYSSLALQKGTGVLVSAIASLYCGGEYIEQFLANITSQTVFSRCELIIIDADSPENEFEIIASYMARFPNIVYHRAATRIGIYEAWNLGVEMSRGRYLTNTNLDDLRRGDSFERQAEILEKFPFVDVTYQDFYFSFDGRASVGKTAQVGVRSELPVVTPYNLIRSNSPHNAPMWRRSIHADVGMFDDSYRSAGDHDFWLRCVEAGKVFYKVNDPHVVYFVNPEGLSTRPNSRGVLEGMRTTKEHSRRLISPKLLSTDAAFLEELGEILGDAIGLTHSEAATPEWRYAAVQRALRMASIASRQTHELKG